MFATFMPYTGGGGVCMMSNTWKDNQHSSFINFIVSFLSANSFRLNFVPINPVFSYLCLSSLLGWFITQLSRTFICRILFSTVGVCPWHSFLWQTGIAMTSRCSLAGSLLVVILLCALCFVWCNPFYRVQKLKGQFAHLYVVVTLPTRGQNDSFFLSYFKWVSCLKLVFKLVASYFGLILKNFGTLWVLVKIWNRAWQTRICARSRLRDGFWEDCEDSSCSRW